MNQKDFYKDAHRLLEQKKSFVTVTIVDVLLSAPQDVGAKMIVSSTGLLSGTVGGGKLEAAAIEHAKGMLEHSKQQKHDLVRWNLKKDIHMTCGGEVSLFFEVNDQESWNIVVFGAGHVSQALIPLLLTLNCTLSCIETRQEWLDRLPDHDRLDKKRLDPMCDYVSQMPDHSFLISITQGHAHDLPILAKALLERNFPYVGVIGSASKAVVLKRNLREQGVSDDKIKSLICPIGLKLGSREPSEIAVSIAAQLIQKRESLL